MIRVSEKDGVGTITLARPELRNALSPAMLEDLAESVQTLGSRARCVLIEGEGRVFCAGFDLSLCRESRDGEVMRSLLTGLDAAVRTMRGCPVPVVIACQGAAIAGGCALVAGADFTVAEREARLGYPVVLIGVSPAVSGPTLVPRVGAGAARVRMLDPGLISGVAAARIGLVSDLVDACDEVGPAARRLAGELAVKGRGGLAATKQWLNALDGTAQKLARVGPSDSEPSLARGALCSAEAPSSHIVDGLGVSLGLAGGEEERVLLERYWSGRRR